MFIAFNYKHLRNFSKKKQPQLKKIVFLTIQQFDDLLAAKMNSESSQFQDTNDAVSASRKKLSSYHSKIRHCLDDLGLICAIEVLDANILWEWASCL